VTRLTSADFRFGLKTSLFLYLLNVPFYLVYVTGLYVVPPIYLAVATTFAAAYWMACGLYRVPVAAYSAVLAAVVLDIVAPPSAVFGYTPVALHWVVFTAPAALLALVFYALAFGRGLWRLVSLALLLAAVVAGHLYLLLAGVLWRLAVPPLPALPPEFPQPQDLPLYVVLYELWRKIHQRPAIRRHMAAVGYSHGTPPGRENRRDGARDGGDQRRLNIRPVELRRTNCETT